MELRYTIKQDRQLYQIFPDKEDNMRYALPIPRQYILNNPKEMYDRYNEYYKKGKIDYIEDMIDNGLTYTEIRKILDL